MKPRLQKKVTVLIVIFTLLLISASVIIQLRNQMHSITLFNTLKAKLTTQILRDALQKAASETPQRNRGKVFDELLFSYKNAGLMETAYIYTPDGKIVTSLPPDNLKTASGIEFSIIKEALKGPVNGPMPVSQIEKESIKLYIPISSRGRVDYIVCLKESLGNPGEAFTQAYLSIILTVMVISVASIFFLLIVTERIIKPISLLNDAVKSMAAGDHDLKVHIDTNDELSELADAFNRLALEIKKKKAQPDKS